MLGQALRVVMAICLTILFLLDSAAGQRDEDTPLDCYDGPFEDALMDGCVDSCSAFETLREAEGHCNSLQKCNGIVKTAYGDENALRLGVGLYEVRMGPNIQDAKGDMMWIKQEVCGKSLADEADEETQPLYNQQNDKVWDWDNSQNSRLGLEDNWDEGWDEGLDGIADAYRDTFLNKFVMSSAQKTQRIVCKSVFGLYMLRQMIHPQDPVDRARLLRRTLVILMTFLAISCTVIFISYKMGHEVTVEIVDRVQNMFKEMYHRRRGTNVDVGGSRGTYDAL